MMGRKDGKVMKVCETEKEKERERDCERERKREKRVGNIKKD
jgi:hypothetical protein